MNEIVMTAQRGGEELWAELYAAAYEKNLPHFRAGDYPCVQLGLPTDGTVLFSRVGKEATVCIVEGEGGIARVLLSYGSVSIEACGSTVEGALATLWWVERMYQRAEPEGEQVEVSFWNYGQHGTQQRVRTVDAQPWAEVEGNYGGDARKQLEALVGPEFEPGRGGQLLLWSGQAGTGKTNALRALAQEWRDWCAIHYIVDPEHFFGTHSDYLMEVLIGGEDTRELVAPGETPRKERWRLLVLEDSGELLSKDAAQYVGKALGRLLNTVDGLVGQGLRVMVLVTTNEEVGTLHDAIARAGRCAVQIVFDKLGEREADVWREKHGLGDTPSQFGRATLAELYAELHGFQGAKLPSKVGFAA